MEHAKRGRAADLALCALLCAGLGALTYCLLLSVAQRGGDFSIHTAWAAEMNLLQPRSIVRHVVHFLWHLPVGFLARLGVDATVAACLTTALWKVGQFLLLRGWLLRADAGRDPHVAATLWALAGVWVASLRLPGQYPGGYFTFVQLADGAESFDVFGSPNVWHSPTQIASMTMALLTVPCLVRLLRDFETAREQVGPSATLPWKRLVALAALLCLGVLAKPTFLQAFLPAAGSYGLWLLATRYRGAGRFFGQVLVAFLPALLLFAFSYLYYGGVVSAFGSGLALRFSLARLGRGLRNLLLMSALPLYALCVAGKGRCRGNHAVWLALLMMLWALVEYALFEEQGLRGGDGNMGWALMSASALLWAAVLPLCRDALRTLREVGTPGLARGAALAAGALLLGWHLYSGVYYVVYLFGSTVAM